MDHKHDNRSYLLQIVMNDCNSIDILFVAHTCSYRPPPNPTDISPRNTCESNFKSYTSRNKSMTIRRRILTTD